MSAATFKSSLTPVYSSTKDSVGKIGDLGQSTDTSLLTKIDLPVLPYQRFRNDLNVTNIGSDYLSDITKELSPIDRVYPHIFDVQTPSGNVLGLLKDSINEATLALEAYSEPDMASLSTHLTKIAVIMSKAHTMADFNRSFSGVISYIRRATLTTPPDQLDRAGLNIMINVLNAILLDPMINLDDASDLTEKLSRQGWTGELDIIEILIQALINDTQEEAQTELFDNLLAS